MLKLVGFIYIFILILYLVRQLLDKMSEVKYRLQCQLVQKWNLNVFNSFKCINHRIFQTNFMLEKYLIELSVKSFITLAKFRITKTDYL